MATTDADEFRREVVRLAWMARLEALAADCKRAGFTHLTVHTPIRDMKGWDRGHIWAAPYRGNADVLWGLLRKHKIPMGCGNGNLGGGTQAQIDGWGHRDPWAPRGSPDIDIDARVLMDMAPMQWVFTKEGP